MLHPGSEDPPRQLPSWEGSGVGLFPGRRVMCLAPKPTVGEGRGIYPAGTSALQIRVGEFQGPFPTQSSCGLKSAPRSLAERPR